MTAVERKWIESTAKKIVRLVRANRAAKSLGMSVMDDETEQQVVEDALRKALEGKVS